MENPDQEFPQDPSIAYLNHAAVAPWPRRATEAVEAFARENLHQGALAYPRWLEVEDRLREQLRELIGAGASEDIALLKNTSEGLSVIASGLDWQPGDRVVISDQEFPSNRIPWEALAEQGVETIAVSLDSPDPEGCLIEAMGAQTRLLSISSVQYGTGLKLDLQRLGEACRERGVLFCVDAIQSLGAQPMDVTSTHADFVVADGHKWMLGPEGLALFWCAPEIRERLRLHQHGWHMVEAAGDFDRAEWKPAASARRFECGSPNLLGAHALSASLSLLLETGMEQVAAAIRERIDHLAGQLCSRHGVSLITPGEPARRAGIITFVPSAESPRQCHERLRQAGVVCALRGGGVRLSPHFYTPWRALEQALDVISEGG